MGKHAKIHDNVRIKGPVVLGEDAVIEEGAELENVILWNNAHIGKNAKLSVVVGANNITFEADSKVSGTVIGDDVTVKAGCEVVDQDIQPGTVVNESLG